MSAIGAQLTKPPGGVGGWSQLPVPIAVAEADRVRQAREERWAAQKQALCKQVLAQQAALARAEEGRDRAERDADALRKQHDALLLQSKEQAEAVRALGDLNSQLKDDLLAAKKKLEDLAEWRLHRERAIRDDEQRRAELAERDEEIQQLTLRAGDATRRLAREEEGHRETRRLLQCQLSYAEELCKGQRRLKAERVRRDDAARAAERDAAAKEERIDRLTRELRARDARAADAETEARRLRRGRVDARRALLDAEDAARERELLIRDVQRENADLNTIVAAAREAALQQQQEIVEVAQAARPVAVVEVEAGAGAPPPPPAAPPAPGPLLTNMREHNGMLMNLLTNLLQQQSAQQNALERRLTSAPAAVLAP